MKAEIIKENIGRLILEQDYKGLNSFIKDLTGESSTYNEELRRLFELYKPRIKSIFSSLNRKKRRCHKLYKLGNKEYKGRLFKLTRDCEWVEEILEIMDDYKKYDSFYSCLYDILFNNRDINTYRFIIRSNKQYINPIDNNGKSLFENALNEYLDLNDKEDKEYYLKVLALILEKDPYSERNEKIILDFLESPDLNSSDYETLVMLFKHYIRGETLVNASLLDKLPIVKSNYKEDIYWGDYMGIPNLKDWSNKDTFTIGTSNVAYTIEDIIDEKTGKKIGTSVCIHVPDLSEYLDDNSDAYDYAKRKMFGRLFNEKFIDDHVSFQKDKKRFALTGVFTFDIYNKMKDFNLYKSIIEVNKEYEDNNSKETESIFSKLSEFFPRINRNNLKKYMSDILNLETAKLLKKRRIPIIYKNFYDINNMERTLANSDSYKTTRENFKKYLKECREILRRCHVDNEYQCVSFDTKQDGRVTSADIANPIHRFTALNNQINIKKYYIDGFYDQEEIVQDRNKAKVITAIANALNKQTGTRVEKIRLNYQGIIK